MRSPSRRTKSKVPSRRSRPLPAALRELIQISAAVGADPDLAQGGGGNTSVKTASGRSFFVKASGACLADVDRSHGWVELELAPVRELARDARLLDLDAHVRESRVAGLLSASLIRPLGARASVETTLHALLDRVVIHTHPAQLNVILSSRAARRVCGELFARLERPPLYLPYLDPGFVLGERLGREIDRYQKEHGVPPAVVLLENHGLFVAHSNVDGCLDLHRRVVAIAAKTLGQPRVNPFDFPPVVDEAPPKRRRRRGAVVQRSAVETSSNAHGLDVAVGDAVATANDEVAPLVRGALLRAGVSHHIVRRDREDIANEFVRRPAAIKAACRGAFTPDQIMYCRKLPLRLDARRPAEWTAAVTRYRDEHEVDPRVIIVANEGVFYAAPTLRQLRVVADVYRSAIAALLAGPTYGGCRFLTAKQAGFIESWEAKGYQAKMQARQGDSCLEGQVALVTGAGSGLGKGIAHGLVRAGASVVGCDLSADGLAATAAEMPTLQFLPVVADVTQEDSVAGAVRAAAGSAGGLDILVNAAGIAPAHLLVDFPLRAWQRTLDINLTGYFLCAREAARLLLAQNAGGSIINITSKSGLEASKANSAYNATKAGEIHLMRGWAMELGAAGIRVNCVAPGNVFRGSQIWNAEYIRAAAKKKGIRPEEVIPYYTSLSPLQQEIEPEDVANAVVYLASDAGRKLTGQTLVVDGGQVMVR